MKKMYKLIIDTSVALEKMQIFISARDKKITLIQFELINNFQHILSDLVWCASSRAVLPNPVPGELPSCRLSLQPQL